MLNRLLPFNKDKIEEFFKFDKKTGVSETCPTAQMWGSLDLTPMYADSKRYFSVHQQVQFVQDIAKNSQSIIASDCMPQLLDMFYRNYFSFLNEAKEDMFAELVLDWAKEDLSVGFNLLTAIDDLQKNIFKYMSSGRKVGKLNICTIHGTKGLEFNHVILNLESERTVPAFQLSAKAKQFQDNEENRLGYVAATRQIDSLTVLCNTEFKHRLADEKYFHVEEPAIMEAKYTAETPTVLAEGNILGQSVRPRGTSRRSMLLED